jgi:NADH-quinone oxidoreductase subunit J
LETNILYIFTFYLFACITVVGGVGVLSVKNVFHAALCLLTALLGAVGLYVYAGADFVAVTQLMVYVGGVLVLLIFGVMFTNTSDEASSKGNIRSIFVLIPLLIGVIAVLSYIPADFLPMLSSSYHSKTTALIGILYMTDYILAFELSAVLLLIALIGAGFVASKK